MINQLALVKRRPGIAISLVITLFTGCILYSCKSPQRPPNILWLMTDEHRGDALGCAGTPWVYTPNLDRLASEGALFLNAYTQSPVCTPARISILTDNYCSKSGVWRNIGNHSIQFDLLTDIFKDAGYRSATFGKQHYGGPKKAFDKEVSLVISEYVDPYGYDKRYDESRYDVVKYPETTPDWAIALEEPYSCDHCGTRFGLKVGT